jgi:hypothetical protein
MGSNTKFGVWMLFKAFCRKIGTAKPKIVGENFNTNISLFQIMVYNPDINTFLKSIDKDNADIILSLLKEEMIKKNTVLLSEGKICTKNYIIKIFYTFR